MRVLVCGSRTFNDVSTVCNVLDGFNQRGWRITTLIHGAARGADTIAAIWGEDSVDEVLAFPADWELHGKRAGFLRNQQMLEEGKPDLVIAFVDKPIMTSKGTANMVALARGAKVKTIIVEVS